MARDEDGYIIEFVAVGRYVKVSAVDPRTGTEVSIVGDPMRGEAALRRVAAQKLRFVLSKQQAPGGGSGGRFA
ncbi:MAG: hypothetical protein AB7G39_16965 [Alphaproteobacteria bacterium]